MERADQQGKRRRNGEEGWKEGEDGRRKQETTVNGDRR